jgi:hexulose-6-phosphate isomerase
MDRPVLRAEPEEVVERVERLDWLLGRCGSLGVGRVVLPFVDASRIDTDDELAAVVAVLEDALPTADRAGVELHLETSLSPIRFGDLLSRLPADRVKVNYDSGNSASLGYAPRDEFAAYGQRVGSVHIKDRVLGGTTVPLGSGDTDFAALFDCLAATSYAGDFVLQVARGVPGEEVSWAAHNREYVRALQALQAAQA